jgi:DNA (cytosine-5)-methyltransferase 1
LNILDEHPEVKYLIMENVRNLADKRENWEIIKNELIKRNFFITEEPIILSPSDFGIPQIRERVYILGIRKDIRNEEKLKNGFIHLEDLHLNKYYRKCQMNDAWSILEKDISNEFILTPEQELMIEAWDIFRKETKIKLIGFPIWISAFGLNSDDNIFYNEIGFDDLPLWKQKYILSNRKLYLGNYDFINQWVSEYMMLKRTKLFQKFEWNCGEDVTDIRNTIIQIRQSGIRAKRPTFFPSLVAMVNTPIIWDRYKKHFRYITPREAANLQNFGKEIAFTGTKNQIYSQLGNSVNVSVIKILAKSLFNLGYWEGSVGEEN